MDRNEALAVLRKQLDRLERAGYEALAARVGENVALEVRGGSGTGYQVELTTVWDAAPGGAIRILGSVDDGGWRAFHPLCETRLLEPPSPSQ
jgi:hypothetical protein